MDHFSIDKHMPADEIAVARTGDSGLAVLISHPVAHGMNAGWRIEAVVNIILTLLRTGSQEPG